MFSLLHVVSYVAAITAFLFVTLSLASGLLYIAELVEEHSRVAKLTGQRAIYAVILLHCLFYFFDRLPLHLVAFGIFCHLVYLQNFSKTWPFISLTSLKFIGSCILVILDHFAWFFYFAERAKEHTNSAYGGRHPRQPGYRPNPSYGYGNNKYAGLRELSFMDVATFFGVCVWLVPFFLFLSLSANDNVLPSLGEQGPQIKTSAASDSGSPTFKRTLSGGADGSAPPQLRIQTPTNVSSSSRSSILKVALDPIISLIPRIGGSKNRSSRSQRDGLIASPRLSGPPSPALFGNPSSFMSNGGSEGYDPANLSPQTTFSNRFSNEHSLRGALSTPQLRMPPGPKRSVTSPPGALEMHTPTSAGFPSSQSPSMYPVGPPPLPSSGSNSAASAYGNYGGRDSPSRTAQVHPSGSARLSPPRNGQGVFASQQQQWPGEDFGNSSGLASGAPAVDIPRSASPFAPVGSSQAGLVSRRKNT